MIANDIIHEFGDAEDYSYKCCEVGFNCADMCFINKFPSQQEMYDEMVRNKQSGLIGCMDAPVIEEESRQDSTRTYNKDKGFTQNNKSRA